MEIRTRVNFEELPENDTTLQSMSAEERAVYWFAVQQMMDAAAELRSLMRSEGNLDQKEPDLAKVRRQLRDAIELIGIVEDMSEARQSRLDSESSRPSNQDEGKNV